jgi:hypothetical protein
MSKSESKEVAVKEKGGAVVGFDFGKDAGGGFEGVTADDLLVPFLNLLQSNSPEVEESNPEGALAGMLFNTATRQLWEAEAEKKHRGLAVVPTHRDKAFVEWIPRELGGGAGTGFVAAHDPNGQFVRDAVAAKMLADPEKGRFGRIELENKHYLAETNYVYALLLDDEAKRSVGFAVISFSSTKLKPCRGWTTAMRSLLVDLPDGGRVRPPLWANRALLRTVKQKNDHGTFFNFVIDPAHGSWADSVINPGEERGLYDESVAFRDMVMSGMAKADFATDKAADSVDGGSAEGGKAPF